MNLIARKLVWAAAILAASCSSTEPGTEDAPWINASPILEEQISNHAARLPWAHGMERIELIRGFQATFGLRRGSTVLPGPLAPP